MTPPLDEGDYYAWLRLRHLGWEDDSPQLRAHYMQSRRRGKHTAILDRKRRQKFGPGRFWAPTSAGVHLNRTFVKGWGGINPANP